VRTLYCGFDPTADSLHIGSLTSPWPWWVALQDWSVTPASRPRSGS
jgi:tyrosyl-tRNA synthetase